MSIENDCNLFITAISFEIKNYWRGPTMNMETLITSNVFSRRLEIYKPREFQNFYQKI